VGRGIDMIKWLERQKKKQVEILDWLNAKAKHSWLFSIMLFVWIGWEIVEHVVLPLAAAAFGILWFWDK
jgi:hypothetical protein